MNNEQQLQQLQQLQSTVQQLQTRITALEKPNNHFDNMAENLFNIIGLFPTLKTSTALSQKIAFPPNNVYDQIFIYNNSGIKLYWYDTSNTSSTFSNGWHYVTLT